MSLTKTFTAEHVGDLLQQVTAWLHVNMPNAATTVAHAVENEAKVLWNETGDTDGDVANTNAPPADKNGLPWNERIHSGSKGLNKDGTWRYKKGASKELIAEVEAELKSQLGGMVNAANLAAGQYQPPLIQQQPQPNIPFPMPGGGVPPMPMGDGAQIQQHPQMINPAVPMPLPVQQPMIGPLSFGEFMQKFVKLTQTTNPATGQAAINQANIPALCQFVAQMIGRPVNAITDIANDPNAIAMAVNKLIADGIWHLV